MRFKFDMGSCVRAGLHAMLGENPVLDGRRIDANETAMFSRQLEHIFAEVYSVDFPALKGRSLFPVKPGPGPGAESYTYREIERRGEAKIIDNFATDFPSADVFGTETSQVIKSLGDSYSYSIQDLRASAMSGMNLSAERAQAAREVMEHKLDALMLAGDTATGLKGFNSFSASYSSEIASTKTGTGLLWTTALTNNKPEEVVDDVQRLCKKVWTASKGVWQADTLVLDTASYGALAYSKLSQYSDTTLMEYVMAKVPGIKSIEHWARLDTAGGSSASRIFAYAKNPRVLSAVIPQDFEQFPPQARALAFVINCHMRVGGLQSQSPKGVCYMDGTGTAAS